VLGLGHIGTELVRFGEFFGMNVSVLTRNASASRAAGLKLHAFGGLDQLPQHLPWADFVVSAVPAAAGTIDLIGAKEISMMKPTACIVNVGRGPVINEAALYDALKSRRLAGAGLDVWWQYPSPGQDRMPSSLPFGELTNVIMSPHKPTFETMAFRWKEIALNLGRFVRGDKLVNVVHPA
jgi:phosphoglycerate dehydrogenase-like enzyme